MFIMRKIDSFSGEVLHNKQTTLQPEITFYFAECMEFISYGEFRETSTLVQAISLFEKCPSERLHARKCVGFILHDNSDYDGAEWSIMTEQRVLKDSTNEIKHFRENPLVQKALKEAEDYLDIKCGKNSNN